MIQCWKKCYSDFQHFFADCGQNNGPASSTSFFPWMKTFCFAHSFIQNSSILSNSFCTVTYSLRGAGFLTMTMSARFTDNISVDVTESFTHQCWLFHHKQSFELLQDRRRRRYIVLVKAAQTTGLQQFSFIVFSCNKSRMTFSRSPESYSYHFHNRRYESGTTTTTKRDLVRRVMLPEKFTVIKAK